MGVIYRKFFLRILKSLNFYIVKFCKISGFFQDFLRELDVKLREILSKNSYKITAVDLLKSKKFKNFLNFLIIFFRWGVKMLIYREDIILNL